MAYTKEELVGAALLRFAMAKSVGSEQIILETTTRSMSISTDDINLDKLEIMFNKFYDERGKDEFRKYASVDAKQMKIYFEWVQ